MRGNTNRCIVAHSINRNSLIIDVDPKQIILISLTVFTHTTSNRSRNYNRPLLLCSGQLYSKISMSSLRALDTLMKNTLKSTTYRGWNTSIFQSILIFSTKSLKCADGMSKFSVRKWEFCLRFLFVTVRLLSNFSMSPYLVVWANRSMKYSKAV